MKPDSGNQKQHSSQSHMILPNDQSTVGILRPYEDLGLVKSVEDIKGGCFVP
jgi:hypothetical protein